MKNEDKEVGQNNKDNKSKQKQYNNKPCNTNSTMVATLEEKIIKHKSMDAQIALILM